MPELNASFHLNSIFIHKTYFAFKLPTFILPPQQYLSDIKYKCFRLPTKPRKNTFFFVHIDF
jgi:hypothetical protein